MVKIDNRVRDSSDVDIGEYEICHWIGNPWVGREQRYPGITHGLEIFLDIIPAAGGKAYAVEELNGIKQIVPYSDGRWDHVVFENDLDWLQFKLTYG